MGGRLNLNGRTLNLDGGTCPPRPPYNLSTGYNTVQFVKKVNPSHSDINENFSITKINAKLNMNDAFMLKFK